MPCDRQQPVGVARQQRVGGHDEVAVGDLAKPLGAVGAMQREDAQLRCETCRLGANSALHWSGR